MRRLLIVPLLAAFVGLSACDSLPTDDNSSDSRFPEVAGQVEQVLGDEVESFTIRELPMSDISAGLTEGNVELPLVDETGQVQNVTLASQVVQLRVPGLENGVERSGATTDPAIEEVPLPPEQNFTLGTCRGADEVNNETLTCGAVTVLDDAQTMLGGMAIHPDVGTVYIQPVDLLLDDSPTSGLHVIYNTVNTPAITFSEAEQPATASIRSDQSTQTHDVQASHAGTQKSTRIVLDGDVNFYQQDTATVWRRQELNLLLARLTYELIEPNSSHTWQLDLDIKGQEVWVSGGPSTTDGPQLNNTLGDPSYFLVHSVEDDEIHFFYVGYNVTGLLGRAGGIARSNSTAFGNGSEQNNAFAVDFPRFSLKKESVVVAHEIGHLLGGFHGGGCTSCSSGSMTGFSLMPAGGAGAATSRDFFFSDANDQNIEAALNSILP